MQEKYCDTMEGGKSHFFTGAWVHTAEGELDLDTSNLAQGIRVHTHVRGGANGLSKAHDLHPLIAALWLLRNADVSSTVCVSVPFF